MILLAVIVAAHGIQGAVKLKTFSQFPADILNYGPLRDESGQEYQLKLVRVSSDDSLIVNIDGLHDRNQAEKLRGVKLYVDRNQLPTLIDDEFYHSDLMGLTVQDLQGKIVGRVCAVSNYGAGDFLEIMNDDHHLYTVPFTHIAVPFIETSKDNRPGFIKIDRQYLLDSTSSRTED